MSGEDELICKTCSQRLFIDSQSIIDLRAIGHIGARLYCLAGCTSVYVRYTQEEPERKPVVRETHTYTLRQPRIIKCKICGAGRETSGNNCNYCEKCSHEIKLKRDLLSRKRSVLRSRNY